ncbi:hypothetical protein [Acinetobacter haemolyticus]|uniref:hypothetical protein n=1 Tax=Acinetobacter haemolyticus TaxID=29430 RepID=UPI0021CD8590|nr:hypothetical protein [Acinetobacter haemolyticus]MCU4378636.1 hypothetical protein [Acinetobacter haemolyticus]
MGGKEKGYKVRKVIDELRVKHYWLETSSGEIIDPTIEQYIDLNRITPYENKETNRVSYRKTKAALTIISNVQKEISKG